MNVRTGAGVPVGTYREDGGFWQPENDGVVMKILGTIGGRAQVSVSLDESEATETLLSEWGFTDEELVQLAQAYPVGKTLWRARLSHFTPVDLNFAISNTQIANLPDIPPEIDTNITAKNLDDPCATVAPGCIIDINRRIMRETIPLRGTDHSISYSTERVPDRKYASIARIPLSGPTISSVVRSIRLSLEVAGVSRYLTFPPAPNLEYTFEWDGRDIFGRKLATSATVRARIEYVARGDYTIGIANPNGRSFDFPNGISVQVLPGRSDYIVSKSFSFMLQPADGFIAQQVRSMAGWTLNHHHHYDPYARVLHFGDGTSWSAKELPRVISTIIGNGTVGFSGDGGAATLARINLPNSVSRGPDGSYFLSDAGNHRIRKVTPDGIINTVIGNGTPGCTGNGGLAINASVRSPTSVNTAPNGDIYFSDLECHMIRRVDRSGIISMVAGTGVQGYSGDGGLATAAQLNTPRAIRASFDGSIYISDSGNHVIRRILPDGTIWTMAGTGVAGFSGDDGPAISAQFNNPNFTAQDRNGNFYIADTNNHRIRVIAPDGTVRTVVGTGIQGFSGDGGQAIEARINTPRQIAINFEGALILPDAGNHRIRFIDSQGIINTIAGTGQSGFDGDGKTGGNTRLNLPTISFMQPDGNVIILDRNNNRVRQLSNPFPRSGLAEYLIPSSDGSEVYAFDQTGRHMRTLFGLTGATKWTFTYDANKQLISTTDADGNSLQITRDGSGRITHIVGPFGQVYQVGTDSNGYLSHLSQPTGESYFISSTTGGLVTTFTNPRGNVATYTYNPDGTLLREIDAAGGYQTLSKNGNRSFHQTRMGRTKAIEYFENRFQSILTTTDNVGLRTTTFTNSDRTSTNAPTKTLVRVAGKDLRFGGLAEFSASSSVFTGSTSSVATETRSYNINSLFSFSMQRTQTVDQFQAVTNYSSGSRIFSTTTGSGRTSQQLIDSKERVTSAQVGALTPIQFSYNSRGQLSQMTQGSRQTLLSYNANGHLQTVTDPIGRVTQFNSDVSGRVVSQVLPDLRVIENSFDGNSNLTSLRTPSGIIHFMDFNSLDLLAVFRPPQVDGVNWFTSFIYNFDKQLTSISRPDSKVLNLSYEETTGRYIGVQSDSTFESVSYVPSTGNVFMRNSSDGVNLTFAYDGMRPGIRTYSGDFNASVISTYTAVGGLLSSDSVMGSQVSYAYSLDRELMAAGNLSLTRQTATGQIASISLGGTSEFWFYNSFGELAVQNVNSGGSSIFSVTYNRDSLGRIASKTETVLGTTSNYAYTYDLSGRLTQVNRDGLINQYTYDNNGNRTLATINGSPRSATYDGQDRIRTFGEYQFVFNENGDLVTKLNNQTGEAEGLIYDVFGQLKSHTRSIGTTAISVEYLTDGERKRVSKRRNGVIVQRFIYNQFGQLVGELNAGSTLVSHFVYATQGHSPDYMIRGGIQYRFVKDQLGSIRLVVNATSGAIAQRMEYDDFGVMLSDSNPGFQPFGFAGGHYDHDTGLVRFGARDYDASTGRWTSKDPILFEGGDVNLYGYVLNDPINLIDPEGFAAEFSDDAKALIDLAKQAKKTGGLTCEQGQTMKTWSKELSVRFRGPEVHPNRPHGRFPHYHIGPVNHIPVNIPGGGGTRNFGR